MAEFAPWEEPPKTRVVTDRSTGSVERQEIPPWESPPMAGAAPWSSEPEEKPEVGLFSVEGVKSIGKTLAPSITRGYHGAILGGLEEVQRARERARQKGELIPVDEEEVQRLEDIRKRRDAIARLNAEVEAATPGKPSKALQIFTGAAQSVATMAPGIAAGVAAGGVVGGPVAMIPGLMLADVSQYGQTYAEGRVPTDRNKAPAPIDEALLNAKVQGLTEAGFELLPTSKLISEVGKLGLSKLVRNYMLREYATEIPTTVAQDITEWATVEKDMPLGEFLSKLKTDVIDTALTVPLVAGAGGGLAKIQQRAGLAIQPAAPWEQGPSGERVPEGTFSGVTTPDSYPTFPAAPTIPQPTITQPPTQETLSLIAQIDRDLDPDKITPEDLAKAEEAVKSYAQAKTAPPHPETMQKLQGLNELQPSGDLGEIGESAEVAAKAKQYDNENDLFARSERVVTFAPEGVETGLMLQQTPLTQGTYTVGTPTSDRDVNTLKAQHDLLESWRQKYMPNETFLLMNESLPTDSAVGWYTQLPSGVHVITPSVLRKMKSSATFNTNAQGKMFYNLAHEFGHGLINVRFFEGVTADLSFAVRREANSGLISEETLAQFDPTRQAVLREFNAIKQEVLDGTMTAQDFQLRWMNPHKVHKYSTSKEHYVPGTAPARQLVDAIIRRATRNSVTMTGAALDKMRNEYLGLDEYLAEQTARTAYAKKWDVAAPRTTQELIGRALQSVRNSLAQFFKDIKSELAPGTKFQEWLDSLTKEAVADLPKVKKPRAKKAKEAQEGAAPKKEAKLKKEPKVEKKPVETIDHNVDSASNVRQKNARAAINSLVKDGTIERGDDVYKELMALVASSDFVTFTDVIQPYLEKKVKFELGDLTEKQYEAYFAPPATDTPQNYDQLKAELEVFGYEAYVRDDELVITKDGQEIPYEEQPEVVQQLASEMAEAALNPLAQQAFANKNAILKRLEKHLQSAHAAAGLPNVPYYLQALETSLTEEQAMQPSVLADAIREWQEKGFESKYFKAWFGDWSGDPVNASKVVTAGGEVLISYHSTIRSFEEFKFGDIGFHFGTMKAAHVRALQTSFFVNQAHDEIDINAEVEKARLALNDPESGGYAEPWVILPVVLNIKNPLDVGFESSAWWQSPDRFGAMLVTKDIITPEEGRALDAAIQANKMKVGVGGMLRDRFKPVRDLLESKGYDGIRYENTVEGDTSWVAFRPEQVKSVIGSRTFSRSPKMHFELDFDEASDEGHTASRLYKKLGPLMKDAGPLRRALRWATDLKFHTLQLQQLAHLNPASPENDAHTIGDDLSFMVDTNNLYERFKSSLMAMGNSVAERYRALGKENYGKVSNYLRKWDDDGKLLVKLEKQNEKWVYTATDEFRQALNESGIDTNTPQGEDLAVLILDLKNSLLEHINQMQNTFMYLLANKYQSRPDVFRAEAMRLADAIHKLRKEPQLPQGWFGNHMLIVEKRKENGPGYQVVHREAFDSREDRAKAFQRMKARAKPDERVSIKDLTDAEHVLMSLPQDFLETVIAELGLKEEQRDRLYELLIPVKRERLFKPYDRKRLGITGESQDVLRSYSNFIWHNSNAISKTRYKADYDRSIIGARSLLRQASLSGDESMYQELSQMVKFMTKTRDAVMSPASEAYRLRSAVALLYLMYNVKTALLNFYGLVTTWADIASDIGHVRAEALMTRVGAATWQSIKLTNLNVRKPGDYLKEDWQWALDRALKEGQLTQSYAYHLAEMANSNNLSRLPARNLASQSWHKFVDLGMWTFRLTELGTRRMTFLAKFELELEKGNNRETAYQNAVRDTNLLQNDYSQGNRVPFLRGGKGIIGSAIPVATVFASFTQHMAFHALGGYEIGQRRADRLEGRTPRGLSQSYTLKIALLTLLLAGYEGLPGAENFLDLMDWLWKKLYGRPVRQDVREGLRELVRGVLNTDSDPLLLAHGLGHDVNLFGLLGNSGFDVSRSLGFGRIFPGTDVMSKSAKADYKADLGSFFLNLMGPTGGVIEWLLKTGHKGFGEGMKRAPGALGNIFNAMDWSEHGVRAPSGAQLTRDLQTGEPRDLTTTEIMGKVLGFNPTVVSTNREITFQQHDARIYWMTRRERLLDDLWKATYQQDREALADARKAVEEFNESIPEKYRGALRLTPKEIANSKKIRAKNMRLEERGLPAQKRYRSLTQDVRQSFDPAGGREEVDNP